MRTLALDYGLRRIGLALSDEGGRLATPLDVLEINSPAEAARRVAERAKREGAERLVVGLPLNMDDTLGPAAKAAIKWGNEVGEISGLPVLFVDERLSSFAADEMLKGQNLTRKGKKKRQDALAAADFLQAFLDGRLQPIDQTA